MNKYEVWSKQTMLLLVIFYIQAKTISKISKISKTFKKSASQKKQPWSCHVQKKPTELVQSLNSTVPRLKRETRFWTRRQWRPKNRTTQGLWIVFDVVIIPQERYFSSNAVAKTIFLQIIYLFVKLIYTEIILFDVVRFNGLCHSFRIFIYLLSLNLGWMSDLRSRPF